MHLKSYHEFGFCIKIAIVSQKIRERNIQECNVYKLACFYLYGIDQILNQEQPAKLLHGGVDVQLSLIHILTDLICRQSDLHLQIGPEMRESMRVNEQIHCSIHTEAKDKLSVGLT